MLVVFDWSVAAFLAIFVIVVILLIRMSSKARDEAVKGAAVEENPHDKLVLRFVEDPNGQRVGETVAVEGDELRCFFHRWRYGADGRCTDIPCLEREPAAHVRVHAWPTAERYGMVWLWTGERPLHDVPEVPELAGRACDTLVANRFAKRCHPNVVLINAIDEQHFRSVHHLPGSILKMEALARSGANIEFRNVGRPPTDTWLGRLIGRFYRGPLTYAMSYWYGSLGFVTFGPDFLHFHLMFALRRGDDGGTEGQTIAFTRHRTGLRGWLVSRALLYLTAVAARYFAYGDTRVFQTIRFQLRNPIAADRAVMAFIKHMEAQPLAAWNAQRSLAQRAAQ